MKHLITKGKLCEIVNVANPEDFSVPSYFDAELYRKGREYYRSYENTFDFATFMGILSVFAVETILETISCTNRSNTSATAYKRYAETIVYHKYFFTDSPDDPKSL